MKRKYLVVLKPTKYSDEVGYTVNVPSLRGCITEGDSVEEALENAREAIVGYVQSLDDRGLAIPPSDRADAHGLRSLSSNWIYTLLNVHTGAASSAAGRGHRKARRSA